MANVKNKYKIGDKVWWFDAWGNLKWGIIHKICDDHAIIYEEDASGGRTGSKLDKCYPTKEECIFANARKSKSEIEDYKESIKDVKDLVIFLWEHDMNTDTAYTDWEAEKAAQSKAKELLGIDLVRGQQYE